MCEKCREEWLSWLDYRPGRSVKLVSIGDSARGVQDGLKARAADWRRTVKTQQAMIKQQCLAVHS